MDIIVLEGPKNCGKTSSLGMLYALMANKAGTTILRGPATIDKRGKKDFLAILYYHGKNIAIFTDGDSPSVITTNAALAAGQKADILIAANSTGKPSNTLFSPHVIKNTFHKTAVPTIQPVQNAGVSLSDYAVQLAANMKTAQDIEAVL
jgi:lysophospholipid acyltransferase (LPLAT)-like uncharacterized protein